MIEVILTVVDMIEERDNGDGTVSPAFPYTKVFRMEFDNKEGFEYWMSLTDGNNPDNVPLRQKLAEKIACCSLEVMDGTVVQDLPVGTSLLGEDTL